MQYLLETLDFDYLLESFLQNHLFLVKRGADETQIFDSEILQ